MTLQELRDKIAAEKQQFQDFKTAKEAEIAQKDARIAELEQQLANPVIPDDIGVEDIVPQ